MNDWSALVPASAAARIDTLVALDVARARVDARQVRLLAALAPAGQNDGKQWIREEIALALRIPAGTVNERLHQAQELTTRLAKTLALLEAGQITLRHATAMVEATHTLTDAAVAEVEAAVLPLAREQTVAELRRCVRRAVLLADPAAAEKRHTRSVEDRHVAVHPGEDGMAHLSAFLPADAACSVATRLDLIAAIRLPGDTRTVAQRRADALIQLATECTCQPGGDPTNPHGPTNLASSSDHADALAHDDEPADAAAAPSTTAPSSTGSSNPGSSNPGSNNTRPSRTGSSSTGPLWHGRRPSVQVTVSLSTLLGLDEQPGELTGHGPIPACMARRIAADPTGTWHRLVTDPLGHLLDYGRTVYRPPQDLTDFIIARDQTSRFPGSTTPARRCDIDHIQPFSRGGPTTPHNLQPLTARQHHLKDEAPDWAVTGDPADILTWTTPTGHQYLSRPPTYPIDHTRTSPAIHPDSDPGFSPHADPGADPDPPPF